MKSTITLKERDGIAAEQARQNILSKAIEIQTLKRKLAAVDARRKEAGQAPDGGAECLQRLQGEIDAAAERFVHGLWSAAQSERPVTMDLANPDAVAFFLRDTISAQLPGLVDRVMSDDMSGSKIDANTLANTLAECDAQEATLKQQFEDLVQRYPEAAKRAGVA